MHRSGGQSLTSKCQSFPSFNNPYHNLERPSSQLLPGGTSAGTSAGTASTSVVVASATSTAPALTATGTGKTTESSVFFSLPSTASGEAATSTGTSGSGSSSNPFRNGAPVGGKHLGVWGVLGVFGVGLISAAVVLV